MAANTLDSIKKKMVAMKGDKDSALDKANQLEEKVAEQKSINEKVSVFVTARPASVLLTHCVDRVDDLPLTSKKFCASGCSWQKSRDFYTMACHVIMNNNSYKTS